MPCSVILDVRENGTGGCEWPVSQRRYATPIPIGPDRSSDPTDTIIANARATLALQDGGETLTELLWSFAPPADPLRAVPAALSGMPALTAESKALARELKRRGFRFVGPTTAYALMQATGIVNDHVAGCFVREAVEAERIAARQG